MRVRKLLIYSLLLSVGLHFTFILVSMFPEGSGPEDRQKIDVTIAPWKDGGKDSEKLKSAVKKIPTAVNEPAVISELPKIDSRSDAQTAGQPEAASDANAVLDESALLSYSASADSDRFQSLNPDNLKDSEYMSRLMKEMDSRSRPAAAQDRAELKAERLEYVLTYLGVTGGKAVIEVKKLPQGSQIYTEAKSDPWLDVFYPVRNYTWGEFAGGELRSYRFQQNEGKRKKNRETQFNRAINLAIVHDMMNKTSLPYAIVPGSVDPLTAFFMLRQMPLAVGDEVLADIFDFGKQYKARIKVLRRESVTIMGKEYRTLVVHPQMMSDGIFARKGDVFIYLTDDEQKLPVLVEANIAVGTVKALLVNPEKKSLTTKTE